MQRLSCFKIRGSKLKGELVARPTIFVLLDEDTIEIRRKESRTIDPLEARFTMAEAYALRAVLTELLPKTEPEQSVETGAPEVEDPESDSD